MRSHSREGSSERLIQRNQFPVILITVLLALVLTVAGESVVSAQFSLPTKPEQPALQPPIEVRRIGNIELTEVRSPETKPNVIYISTTLFVLSWHESSLPTPKFQIAKIPP